MAEKKRLTPEQREALEKEREQLWDKIFEIHAEAKRYLQSILDSVGNKPVVRNPHVKDSPDYEEWKDRGYFDPNPSFWEIKPDDHPKSKAIKAAWKHQFIFECLLTPEENEEYERILAKIDPLEHRINVIDRMLADDLTEEEAERLVTEEEREEEDDDGADLFV
ncbi:hypothetical protein [Thermogutta sp.]|uniref:hypothetical protein n=1 Tax=Thermogutta sp. TaxID=1962930 RepID=UPI003C7ACB3B